MATLNKGIVESEIIIEACDILSKMIDLGHAAILTSVGFTEEKATEYIQEAKSLLCKENLLRRLKMELGDTFNLGEKPVSPKQHDITLKKKVMPLGVLLHIAAGNQQGLAFYSVMEGLLTGNINIVKLSSEDDGLSGFIFTELFKIEPRLKDYVYLFDYSSSDAGAIQKLLDISDAVVVWGGDQAIQSIRDMAKPNTKIIEWGHKLSFAYITEAGMQDNLLKGLAENIITTNQLLCSSCQGIFLDTDSMNEVYKFCERFLPVLEQSRKEYTEEIPIEIQAQTGLLVYTESLRTGSRQCRVFRGEQTALLAYENSELEISFLYGNCWVKRLQKEKLLDTLRSRKNHLQTVGLLCGDEEREELTRLLWKAGLVRVTYGSNMSKVLNGEAHDGEYVLRRYTRIVSVTD
jgi:hypothetical protein